MNKVCFVIPVQGNYVHWNRAAYALKTLRESTPGDYDVRVLKFDDVPKCTGSKWITETFGTDAIVEDKPIEETCKKIYAYHTQGVFAPIVLSKLFLPVTPPFNEYDRIIVVDADMEFHDVHELLDVPVPTGLAAVQDDGLPTWRVRRDIGWNPPIQEDFDKSPAPRDGGATDKYFNAGLMVYDMENLPLDYEDRIQKVIELDKTRKFPWIEQDMMNLMFKFSALSGRFNRIRRYMSPDERPNVVHYCGNPEQKDALDIQVAHALHPLSIHVYAITKNEAKFVDQWVDSMKEADGIHVLDTGSTDGTVEKLRARGVHTEVKTYDPWRFDAPRNDSMNLCPSNADILVCTDLDEILRPGWRGKLETQWFTALEKGQHPKVARYDYIWSFQPDGSPARQFRYEKIHVPHEYEWRYAVHELLFRKDNGHTEYLETLGIMLEHHPDNTKSRGSYLGLLELSVKEDPTNDRNTHYLGRELTFYSRWEDAIKVLEKHISMNGWYAERAMSYMYLGRCHWNLGNKEAADAAWRKASEIATDHREAAFEAANSHYESGEWDKVIEFCTLLFRVKSQAGDYMTDQTAWGWKPYDILGIALWYSGDRDGARQVFAIACDKFPDNAHLRDNLRRCAGEWNWIA